MNFLANDYSVSRGPFIFNVLDSNTNIITSASFIGSPGVNVVNITCTGVFAGSPQTYTGAILGETCVIYHVCNVIP